MRIINDAEQTARRDIIRREEKYRQLVGRRMIRPVSYAEGELTYRQAAQSYRTAIAQRYKTENFLSPPE